MSYLDLPRLCFFGQFRADPSTSNNDACHYGPEVIKNPWWNQMGSNTFQFRGCTVTSVTLPGGVFQSSAAADRIVSTPVISTDDPQLAKLVDLDPEQQMVSQVWGLQLCIGDRQAGNYVLANFRAVNFRDLFVQGPVTKRVPLGRGSGALSATYLSVLDVVEWGKSLSPAMSALHTAGSNLLSIRFVVDLYDSKPTLAEFQPNPNFTLGRVSGAVGPAKPADPRNFVVGRFLRVPNTPAPTMLFTAAMMKSGVVEAEAVAPPAPPPPAFNYGPAIIDPSTGRLSFDFGNSLCVTPSGDPYPGTGTLQAAVAGGSVIGPIPGTLADYTQRSWIYDFFDKGLATAAAKAPLALLNDGNQALIENPNGTYVDLTEWVYRANPEDSPLNVTVMTMQWGKPLGGQTVNIADVSADLLSTPSSQPPDPPPCTNMPFSTSPGISYPPQVTTGSDGTATFQVTLSDPGDPRDGLEGQVYAIAPQWSLDSNPDSWIAASILLHSSPAIPADPEWTKHILPIFAQYMKLYPYMQDRMNLNDEATVIGGGPFIERLLTLPMSDPRFMPVTRDLSSARLKTILKWLSAHEK